MRNIILLLLVNISVFSQPVIFRGKFYDVPPVGYGVDTAITYGLINRNGNGMAGYFMVSGNDTVWLYVDNNGIFRIISDTSYIAYIIGHVTDADSALYSIDADKLDGKHWSDIDTVTVDSALYSYNSDKLDGKHDTAFVSTLGDIVYGNLNIRDTLFLNGDTATGFQNIDQYNFTKIGIGVASNLANYHLQINSGALGGYTQYTNTATGSTLTDGSLLGIDTHGNTIITNQENDTIKTSLNGNVVHYMERGSAYPTAFWGRLDSRLATQTADYSFVSSLGSFGLYDIGTSSTTSGTNLIFQNNDGAALAATHRIGGMLFQSMGTSSALKSGAEIKAIASETWTTSSSPTSLLFMVAPTATTTRRTQFSINPSKAITDNTPATIYTIAFPTDSATKGNSVAGQIQYTVQVFKTGVGRQIESGVITYNAIEFAGLVTSNIAITTSSQAVTPTSTLTAGTPTITFSAGVWTISGTWDSSFTTPSMWINCNAYSGTGGTQTY